MKILVDMRVRQLAERLRVWFDEWVLKPGDRIPAKIEPPPRPSYGGTGEGLEHSRMLACPAEAPERRRMLCMPAQAFGSDWAQLPTHHQPSTLNPQPTCAPLNPSYAKRLRAGRQERRFIPSRLDDAHDRNDCWRRKKARCSPAELGPQNLL